MVISSHAPLVHQSVLDLKYELEAELETELEGELESELEAELEAPLHSLYQLHRNHGGGKTRCLSMNKVYEKLLKCSSSQSRNYDERKHGIARLAGNKVQKIMVLILVLQL